LVFGISSSLFAVQQQQPNLRDRGTGVRTSEFQTYVGRHQLLFLTSRRTPGTTSRVQPARLGLRDQTDCAVRSAAARHSSSWRTGSRTGSRSSSKDPRSRRDSSDRRTIRRRRRRGSGNPASATLPARCECDSRRNGASPGNLGVGGGDPAQHDAQSADRDKLTMSKARSDSRAVIASAR